ncbi:hypothetical protein EYF80_044529 [Liparis tanakae]|uniref:Uncharacterized protein n=1 Tax=Liparis tanakae TaxID=230148 RepID=A0A4Z2FVG2_9TELE|nr:hypothetical protein EYF80_044529 [Liparis tanakae]
MLNLVICEEKCKGRAGREGQSSQLLDQLMRERQQMASRPFASVALALDARGEETELLQPAAEIP